MNNSAIQKFLMSVSLLGLSGCAYQYEPESRFGLTVREAITQQLGDVFRIGVGGVSTDSPANASRSSDRR
jgi:hypothetical protein